MSNNSYGEVCGLISDFICNAFPVAKNQKVKPTDSLIETGMVDSLGFLTVVEFVETEFDIIISETDMGIENFGSIDAISKFVIGKK